MESQQDAQVEALSLDELAHDATVEKALQQWQDSRTTAGLQADLLTKAKTAPFFAFYFFPMFMPFLLMLTAVMLPLSLFPLTSVVGMHGLDNLWRRGLQPHKHRRFQDWVPFRRRNCFLRFLMVLGMVLVAPFLMMLSFAILCVLLPVATLLWFGVATVLISIYRACAACCCRERHERAAAYRVAYGSGSQPPNKAGAQSDHSDRIALRTAMRQAVDFFVRLVLSTLFCVWDVGLNASPHRDDNDETIAKAKRDERPPETPEQIWQRTKRWRYVLATLLVVGVNLILSVFDTVTDVLFFQQMFERSRLPLPPSQAGFFALMVGLSGFATVLNFFVHLIQFVRLVQLAWLVKMHRMRYAQLVFRYWPFLAPPHRATTEELFEDEPLCLDILNTLKAFGGDALHVIISCFTLGFFDGRITFAWAANNATAILSVAVKVGQVIFETYFNRVVRNAAARILMRVVCVVVVGALASEIVILSVLGSIATSSVCDIPWTPDTLTDQVLTTVANTCSVVAFDLVIRNTSLTSLVFEQLQYAVYIEITNNTALKSVSFPALLTLSPFTYASGNDIPKVAQTLDNHEFQVYPFSYCLGPARYKQSSDSWVVQPKYDTSQFVNRCAGICCYGTGIYVAGNDVLDHFSIGERFVDQGYTERYGNPYNTVSGMSAIRIINNKSLQSVAIHGANVTALLVQVSDNPTLRNASIVATAPFTIIAHNPMLASLTLGDPLVLPQPVNLHEGFFRMRMFPSISDDFVGSGSQQHTVPFDETTCDGRWISSLLNNLEETLPADYPFSIRNDNVPVLSIYSNPALVTIDLSNTYYVGLHSAACYPSHYQAASDTKTSQSCDYLDPAPWILWTVDNGSLQNITGIRNIHAEQSVFGTHVVNITVANNPALQLVTIGQGLSRAAAPTSHSNYDYPALTLHMDQNAPGITSIINDDGSCVVSCTRNVTCLITANTISPDSVISLC